ncbi:MAG: arginine N-succinyltransferase [Burkholderiales bacterium PBB5]|nr:MAG: arginine N-succinyltransferase [Burkholderiales bacterium PBB5]
MSPDNPRRWLLRAAQPRDLPALEALARASAIGISSLPPDRDALRQMLALSAKAFASDDVASGEEAYLFVLEDQAQGGALVGTSGIAAAAGFNDRFYSYRNEFIVQASAELGARNRIHTLHLCHDLTGVTLLTGFHIDAGLAHTLAPQLLSRGRLMFIAQFAEHFSDRIAAENPGLSNEQGACPFWDAVGRRFFNMDYPAAERLGGGRSHKGWIAGLMPQSPIYVPLLPDEAQWALGQLHPVAELPFSILMDEGFDGETYLNLFDGGPTADGRVALLKTVARRRALAPEPAARTAPVAETTRWQLVANGRQEGFRATLQPVGEGAALPLLPEAATALGWQPGQPLWGALLDAAADKGAA